MSTPLNNQLSIQIVQDLTCPWCYIGHRNLETALAEVGDALSEAPTVDWFPYLLDPIGPGEEGEDFRQRFMRRKGIAEADMNQMFARTTAAGAAVGIEFRFDRVTVAVDTVPGHVAIAAAPKSLQGALVNELHADYFTNGKNIGQTEVIVEAARRAGVDDDGIVAIESAIASPVARAETLTAVRNVQQAGITSVPYTVIGEQYGLNGGQPAEVFRQAIEQSLTGVTKPSAD